MRRIICGIAVISHKSIDKSREHSVAYPLRILIIEIITFDKILYLIGLAQYICGVKLTVFFIAVQCLIIREFNKYLAVFSDRQINVASVQQCRNQTKHNACRNSLDKAGSAVFLHSCSAAFAVNILLIIL